MRQPLQLLQIILLDEANAMTATTEQDMMALLATAVDLMSL